MLGVVTGTLRIGASYTVGEYVLPELVSQTATKYPNLNISVTIANTEQIAQDLTQNRLDMALVEGQINDKSLVIEPFMKDKMVLIVPADHPLTMMKGVTEKELDNQIWIFREAGSGTREFSDQFIKALNLNVQHSYVFSSNKGVKAAVVSGLGIALVSGLIVERELEAGELQVITIFQDVIPLTRKFIIARATENYVTKASDVFLEELHDYSRRSK